MSWNLYCHALTSALQEILTPSSAAGSGLHSVSETSKKFLNLLICTKARLSTADILKQIIQNFQTETLRMGFHIVLWHLG